MAIQAATPYLILNGKAQQAIKLYESALGAKVEALQRFGDVDKSCHEAQRDNVMHAELQLGSAKVMLSDGSGESPTSPGGSVSVALLLDDVDQARRSFDALGNGGTVIQPLIDAPWGALFGVVRDPFGIDWMFNCTKRST